MSESTNLQESLNGHCRRLRCKEMFIDIGVEFKMAETGSGIYWCSHTQNVLGPDGQVAEPSGCKSERECFEGV
ncbi:MAG TPA: hypothetical protein VKV95_23605 [Terriglobia bacterium]|nr:hypothetical protein [Terriglobia bacterium]